MLRRMRKFPWLFVLLHACGPGLDTPPASGGTVVATSVLEPVSSGSSWKPAAAVDADYADVIDEPFAIAEVAYEVDAFEPRPVVALPADAKLEIGMQGGTKGQGADAKSLAAHPATIRYAGDIDVFDREIAAPFRAAVKLPPETFLAFHGPRPDGTFEGVVLRRPFLFTSADVVSAEAGERTKTTIALGPGAGHTDEAKAYALKIVLDDAAATRLAAWNEKHALLPLAYVIHGRVAEQDSPTVANAPDFFVDLPWAQPSAKKATAEKLAKEIRARAKKH
jgi:hypothetical protein